MFTDPLCVQSPTVDPGLRIYRVGTTSPTWVVVLPDSSSITLSCCPVGVVVQLASTRRSTMIGLCGSNDDNVNNDLVGFDHVQHGGTIAWWH